MLFIGLIHGDFNQNNVIVRSPSESTAVTIVGVIDFGESERAPYVYDLAISIMYAMLRSSIVDPLDVGGHMLAGYLSRRQGALSDAERTALWPCVAARFAQSLTMGAYAYSLDPSNPYVLDTAKRGWTLLRHMWVDTSIEQLNARTDAVLARYGYTSRDTI